MAYDTYEQNDIVIPFFSTKDITYRGFKIGDDQNDNRRILRDNRFLISQIGDESGNCSTKVMSCAGKCLRGNLETDNHTLDEREIWCRNHCNMTSTGYLNLLGKPIGLDKYDNGELPLTIMFYIIVVFSELYIGLLAYFNCCASGKKNYSKIKETATSCSTYTLALLGIVLNLGYVVFILIFPGPKDYVGAVAWFMAAVVDGVLLCVLR